MNTIFAFAGFRFVSLNAIAVFLLLFSLLQAASAQEKGNGVGFRLSPGRVQLEIPRGGEKTVALNVVYGSAESKSGPIRVMAYLNDWNMTKSGELSFHKAETLSRSAAPWMIYSPAESIVHPGQPHTIRVTVTVPLNAEPGDHLAALMIEPRANDIKAIGNGPKFRVTYRLAALFYITVPDATRVGSLEDLKAQTVTDGFQIIPTLKNQGNSVIRPTSSIKVISENNVTVYETKEEESMAVLGQTVLSRPINFQGNLVPGVYTVRYRVNFNDGSPIIEGVTNLHIRDESPTRRNVAKAESKPSEDKP